MAAITRPGLLGAVAAYLGFSPKTPETVIVAIPEVIVRVGAYVSTVTIPAYVQFVIIGPYSDEVIS